MNGKTLSNAELELTQRIQLHFPRGVVDPQVLRAWNGCPKEFLSARLIETFGVSPGTTSPIFKLISGAKRITIDAVDGQEVLADARDVFAAGIDSDLKNWDVDEKGPATDETAVAVYEMAQNATFAQMFTSLGTGLRNLCLTQAQIKNFVKKHPHWLRSDGYATFFLLVSHGQFFVAGVGVYSGRRLYVDVYRFEGSDVWNAEDCRRVVVPQLA